MTSRLFDAMKSADTGSRVSGPNVSASRIRTIRKSGDIRFSVRYKVSFHKLASITFRRIQLYGYFPSADVEDEDASVVRRVLLYSIHTCVHVRHFEVDVKVPTMNVRLP